MFAFGDREWPGVAKFVEETGEMGQVIGRLMMMHGQPKHWTGANLRSDFIDELADVQAATRFVKMKSLTEEESDRLNARSDEKLARFLQWHREQAESEECLLCADGILLHELDGRRPGVTRLAMEAACALAGIEPPSEPKVDLVRRPSRPGPRGVQA